MNHPTQRTVDTLIEMDEPEALLETIRREAQRKSGPRWKALSGVLDEASLQLDLILNAKPAGPDFRADAPGAKGNSQPQPTGADHDKPADPAAPSPATGPAASPATAAS
jgi:hypothetical protein